MSANSMMPCAMSVISRSRCEMMASLEVSWVCVCWRVRWEKEASASVSWREDGEVYVLLYSGVEDRSIGGAIPLMPFSSAPPLARIASMLLLCATYSSNMRSASS